MKKSNKGKSAPQKGQKTFPQKKFLEQVKRPGHGVILVGDLQGPGAEAAAAGYLKQFGVLHGQVVKAASPIADKQGVVVTVKTVIHFHGLIGTPTQIPKEGI